MRLVLVDDAEMVRNGLQHALASEQGVEAVVSADNFGAALGLAMELPGSLLVADLKVAGRSLVEFMQELRRGAPSVRVLVLTCERGEAQMRAAIAAGASAYVLKDDGYSELLEALRYVELGRRFLSETVESVILDHYAERVATHHAAVAAPITAREREVLARVGQGQTNKLIAKELRLSVKTVEKHRSNLMRKLGLHNTAAVTVYAIRQGLVSQGSIMPGPPRGP